MRHFRPLALAITALLCLLGTAEAAAIYDPGTGRFMQRDPSGYPDGMNSYAGYHAMRGGVDPSGLDDEWTNWNMVDSKTGKPVRLRKGNKGRLLIGKYPKCPEGKIKDKDYGVGIGSDTTEFKTIESGQFEYVFETSDLKPPANRPATNRPDDFPDKVKEKDGFVYQYDVRTKTKTTVKGNGTIKITTTTIRCICEDGTNPELVPSVTEIELIEEREVLITDTTEYWERHREEGS